MWLGDPGLGLELIHYIMFIKHRCMHFLIFFACQSFFQVVP